MTGRTPQEDREQVVALAKGDKGDRGEQGKRGEQGMTRGARRAIIYLFTLTVVLAGLNLFWTSREVGRVRAAVVASCGFAAALSSAPLAVNPKTGKASLLAVKIVADSRAQWLGLGCPGRLPPPSPSFVKWAKAYGQPWH